jgi:beta-lactam-binding protein with PASTA domain
MPDVRGLDKATAEQVLADSAIPVDAITTHDAPSVVKPGVVVEQSPAFGASDISKVDLGIAVPVRMPDLVGKTQDRAVEILSGYGTGVTITYGYSNAATAGTVLTMTPAEGKSLGQTASIVVATAGSTLPLTQIHTIDGGCSSDTNVAIDGHDYSTALACSTNTGQATSTTWMLSKTVDRFTATVGIADNGTPGAAASYELLIDGKIVAKGTASFGAASKIDVPCTGAIQLTLRVGPTSADAVNVAFGDAVVYGAEEGIARLAKLQ